MPVTYKKIASVTVGSGGAANIEFTNIPATYTDLVVKLSARNSTTSNGESYVKVEFNSVTSNYSRRNLYRSGSSVFSDNASAEAAWFYIFIVGGGSTASTFSNTEIYIPNYAGSNQKNISVDTVSENNATASAQGFFSMLNSSTAAITSLKITGHDGSKVDSNLVQYTTATLYGVSKS